MIFGFLGAEAAAAASNASMKLSLGISERFAAAAADAGDAADAAEESVGEVVGFAPEAGDDVLGVVAVIPELVESRRLLSGDSVAPLLPLVDETSSSSSSPIYYFT